MALSFAFNGVVYADELGDLLSDISAQSAPICQSLPVVERIKYRQCRIRYFDELPIFLDELERLRFEELEAVRSRPWEWFVGPPIVDCEVFPEYESDKFINCASVVGGDPLSNLRERLATLKGRREGLVRQIDRLKARHASLAALEVPNEASSDLSRDIQAMETSLQLLDRAQSHANLLDRLSEVLPSLGESQPVSGLLFFDMPASASYFAAPDPTLEPFAVASPEGDLVILVRYNDGIADFLPIVHPFYGLAHVARSEVFKQ